MIPVLYTPTTSVTLLAGRALSIHTGLRPIEQCYLITIARI